MILQGGCFNNQIPTKIYEYFRLKKTIPALVPLQGETGKLIKSTQSGIAADQEDGSDILQALHKIFSAINERQFLPKISESKQ